MDNTYARFMAEGAFKHTVDKPNTNKNLSFYEEEGKISHRVDLESIWIDSKYIPVEAPTGDKLDENGIYYVEEHGIKLPILKRWDKVRLFKVIGTEASYRSTALLDAIFPSYGTGYSLGLIDDTGAKIPFGLNQWVIDPDSGVLSFLSGWPEGFIEDPKISFYSYVGRKADKGLLVSNGSIPMDENYVPTNDRDIATKGYVDQNTSELGNDVKKLIPTEPATLQDAQLKLVWNGDLMASPWNSENKMPVVLYNKKERTVDDFKIEIPEFYYPKKGIFKIFLNNHVIFERDMSTIGIGTFKNWHVTSMPDPYAGDIVANGFFTVVKSFITLSYNQIEYGITDESPFISLYVQTDYNFKTYKSNPIIIGFDEHNSKDGLQLLNYNIDFDKGSPENKIKYISGVPSLVVGDKISYDVTAKPIIRFKNDTIGSFFANKIKNEPIYSLPIYDSIDPSVEHHIEETIEIPENIFIENLDVGITLHDVSKSIINERIRNYNIYVDTVSDESNRKISPKDLKSPYYPELEDWTEEKAKIALTEEKSKNELQLLNGLYRWPTGDYTKNGDFSNYQKTKNPNIATTIINLEIPKGPNYNEIVAPDLRFATFAVDIPSGAYANGFWITINDAVGITSNKDTQATDIPEFRCKVSDGEDSTGWLNMNIPYEGVLSPTENNEGCLVVASSTENTKYITFGSTPRRGTLCITIGIKNNSNIMFSGVDIVFNI